ncbi:hypothetical protein LCI18_011610 [Fusarium solani-melongenae]|uniref:Uncharacterized protein n=1 Tax=Fusarium solani subsp. cucurbitae TaxID=2747967 RepID=A0ACD3ZHV1_FUSSC|nr:hypothetical protein LCI18_011610 [Fusarium solani-melongenae]
MASLSGKVFCITGCASGVGRATAQLLAARGATLSIADMNKAGLDETLQSISGGPHSGTVVDVTDSNQVSDWIKATVRDHSKLDGAANVAGINMQGRLKNETDENLKRIMETNAFGVFYCLREQLNQIVPSGGSIVNVASIGGLIGLPGCAAYTASKHAVVGLTRVAARENPNVRINVVAPKRSQVVNQAIINRVAAPQEIANVIAFLLSDDAGFITGSVYPVDGGWTA